MAAATRYTKWEACWRFFSNYCCTLPPSYRPARLVGEKTPTDFSHPFGTVSIQNRTKGGALEKKISCSGPVSSWFFAIFALKTKLFWSSYKIQKEWPYNLQPYQMFKKIFSLRHHGVKLFWTKVGVLSPMPLLLGLTNSMSF